MKKLIIIALVCILQISADIKPSGQLLSVDEVLKNIEGHRSNISKKLEQALTPEEYATLKKALNKVPQQAPPEPGDISFIQEKLDKQ